LQTFDLKGGMPIFKAGNETAAVVNHAGKGKIWLFGTFIGHGGTAYYSESNLDYVRILMDDAAVSGQKINDLLVQKRITPEKEAWIITNPTPLDVVESLALDGMMNPVMLTGDIQQQTENLLTFRLKSLDVSVLVFEK
jgi:hypothetical protein